MSAYDLMTPADGWFFVHGDTRGGVIIHRVVVWVQETGGAVVGLIAAADTREKPHGVPFLVQPPGVDGDYLHFDDLSAAEKDQLRHGRNRRTFE